MKLLTFNVQHFRNYITREIDIDLFARTIKEINPDIICLNEVFGEGSNDIYGDQVKEIASKLDLNYFFGKAISIPKGNYGNAILSKYPIENQEIIPIPDPLTKNEDTYYETRILIKAKINNIYVFITHMGLAKDERINATKVLEKNINNLTEPFVIMGDFNMTPNDSLLKPIYKYTIDVLKENDGNTFSSVNPERRIDYILVSKNIKKYNGKIIEKVVSDHFPIVSNLEF